MTNSEAMSEPHESLEGVLDCPFCGSQAENFVRWDSTGNHYFLTCYHCGANGPLSGTQKMAQYHWNEAKR